MLDVIEDVRNEFKVKLTDKFEEEVISLNTNVGNIRTIQRKIKTLIEIGLIERIGATKKGEWIVKDNLKR